MPELPHTFVDLPTGARLHTVDTGGPGTPLLLIHGLLDVPALHYGRLIDWLAADYRVIAPSLRGYGQSLPAPRRFPRDFYHIDAADGLALLDALGIERAHLMGYSDGGEVALLMGCERPGAFHSVAVWGAVGYYGPQMRPAAQALFPGTWIGDDLRKMHGIANADAFILGWIQSVRSIIDGGGDLSLNHAPRLTAPLLMLLGEDDALNPVDYALRFASAAAQGRVLTFPGGHAVHEDAWDDFTRVVGDFLRQAERV